MLRGERDNVAGCSWNFPREGGVLFFPRGPLDREWRRRRASLTALRGNLLYRCYSREPPCDFVIGTGSRLMPLCLTYKSPGGMSIVSDESVSFVSFENLPPVLKVKEVAALLRISRSQAYELIARRVIPSVRLGKSIRVSRAALEEYLTLQSDPAEAHAPGGRSRTARKAG